MNLLLLYKGIKNPNDLLEQYVVDLFSTKILIDPNGKIINRYGGKTGATDIDLDKKISINIQLRFYILSFLNFTNILIM